MKRIAAILALILLPLCAGLALAQMSTPGTRQTPGTAANLGRIGQVLRGGVTAPAVCAVDPGAPPAAAACVGSFTVKLSNGPIQAFNNGGALTITAPAEDGSAVIGMLNIASAGAVTWTGFTVGSSTGATLNTTVGSPWSLHIWCWTISTRTCGYNIYAHQ